MTQKHRKHAGRAERKHQLSVTKRSDTTMPETNDAGDAISEDTLYDASGAATGGGVDTPEAVVRSTEDEIMKRSHINQSSSAYMGGGADNGTDL